MFANSRPVRSRQDAPHPDVQARLRRHLAHPFQKPVADYNRAAFTEALRLWRGWQPDAPLILDAGCGVGWSSLHLARQWPESFVLGVDQSANRLARGKPERGETPANMAWIRADLVDFWRLLTASGIRLQRHYLLYPNPWPKIGHLKRRWHGHPVFPALLQLGGVLECRSNWRVYVEELALALETATNCRAQVEGWNPESRDLTSCLTPFERKYRESGQALWRLTCDLEHAALWRFHPALSDP
jgi:tRNA (guanine-N7-)-methyltransferase